MKELHEAIIRTNKMLQEAGGEFCRAYETTLRVHLRHLINIAVGKLEQEMEVFTDSPVSYRLPQEIMETLGLGENTQSQLPQDNAEAFAAAVDYADGWRPWSGGDCPHDGYVDVRLRSNVVYSSYAGGLRWGHGTKDSGLAFDTDIVAWRPA